MKVQKILLLLEQDQLSEELLNEGIQAKQNLKNLNGVKTEQNDNIKQLVVKTIQKAKASPITGAYLSRNYYSDYLKYSTILPLFQINKAQVKDKIKDLVADHHCFVVAHNNVDQYCVCELLIGNKLSSLLPYFECFETYELAVDRIPLAFRPNDGGLLDQTL